MFCVVFGVVCVVFLCGLFAFVFVVFCFVYLCKALIPFGVKTAECHGAPNLFLKKMNE